jgi:thiol-disulfide isomerase/thioredoxin
VAGSGGALACASTPEPLPKVSYAALAAADKPAPPVAPERIHALLVNGGGWPEINYASHVAHLREVVSLLTRAGVEPARISILSGDGNDPAEDLAVREPDPERFWMLAGTPSERRLREPTRFESSTVPGFALRPATLAELRGWFKTTGARLRDGDTLLLYVTDHGQNSPRDVLETRIVLWGKDASVSVRELRDLLRALRPGVRVVSLMSQCFSGGFAWLGHKDGDALPEPNVCGYFSSRYDTKAHGCYAELSGSNEVGHSFAFLRALARTGSFDDAHRAVLVTDSTPDVPLRTSDLWLQQLLADMAAAARVDVKDLVDGLLAEAWKNQAAWEPEIRLIDRIGQAYGFASPRSVREMQLLAEQLSHVSKQIQTHAGAWETILGGAARGNLNDFLTATPGWVPRLRKEQLDGLGPHERRALVEELLGDLSAFTARDEGVATTLKSLFERAEAGEALAFRTEIRLAALLRMGALLTSIAGRAYVGMQAEPRLLEAYRAMRACEGLTLTGLRPPDLPAPEEEPLTPMPSLNEELSALEQMTPAWTGLSARPVGAEQAEREELPRGASVVTLVMPRSPAESAGLSVGDVILGPPDEPFAHPQDFRPWAMLLDIGKPQRVVVRRGQKTFFTRSITPRSYPIEWPRRAIRPRIGLPAPPVTGVLYRGDRRPAGRHILFFWATWCKPCKAALPELLYFAYREKAPVVAITSEDRATLDQFFGAWTQPFPSIVIRDEVRRTFVDYGVNSTPTFVLIDDAGHLRGYQAGYSRRLGLRLSGGG